MPALLLRKGEIGIVSFACILIQVGRLQRIRSHGRLIHNCLAASLIAPYQITKQRLSNGRLIAWFGFHAAKVAYVMGQTGALRLARRSRHKLTSWNSTASHHFLLIEEITWRL